MEVTWFKTLLYNAFIVSQLFRKLSYTLLAPGGALCISPGCGASFGLRKLLHSLPLIFWPWCTALPHLRTLGPFHHISITTILGLESFTSIASPYKRGREEQDLHAQGCNSEGLHIHAASQAAMPPPSLLLIMLSPRPPSGTWASQVRDYSSEGGCSAMPWVRANALVQDFVHGSVYPQQLGTASECVDLKIGFKAGCGTHKWICTGSQRRLNTLVSHRAAWCGN